MKKTVLLLASMALAVLLACGVALAAAGDLDPSFDDDGKAMLDIGRQSHTYPFSAVAVHPDGGLVVVGSFRDYAYGYEGLVVRLKSDGSLDNSFGGGDGVASIGYPGTRSSGLSAVVVRPDGKIVVAGYYGYEVVLARYNSNGTLDKSFGGGDGKVITDPPGRSGVSELIRQTDGKLVVAGRNVTDQSQDFLLVRYHADGRRDRSFGGGDGIVITSVGYGPSAATDLVSRSNGKLVVAGEAYRSGHHLDFALLRYNPNGTLDKSFGGGDGRAYADFGYKESALALVRYNGGVIAAGFKQGPPQGADTLQKFALARFTSDGRLDQRFGGGDGKVLTAVFPGGHSFASDLVVQTDGKLVAAGGGDTGDFANSDFALARYHPGGRLDTTFGGGDGKALTDFGERDDVSDLALQPNGKIVAAGSSMHYDPSTEESAIYTVALARYLAE